jgi:hypothetical protein
VAIKQIFETVFTFRVEAWSNLLINMLPDGYIAGEMVRPFLMRQMGIMCGKDCLFRKAFTIPTLTAS